MIVTVDPSVVIAVILNEPVKPRLLESTRGSDLISAPSMTWEIGNALSALCKRSRITPTQANEAYKAYSMIPIRSADIDVSNAVDLAGRRGIYAYDAYILACAMKYRTPLLTLDKRQREEAEELGIATVELPS